MKSGCENRRLTPLGSPLMHMTSSMKAVSVLAAVLAAGTLPEPTPAELEANRRRYELLQQHPDKLKELRADAQAFFALPEARQREIAEIDQALRQQPPALQQRLAQVLDRYNDWLRDLEDKTRNKITLADNKTRPALIRELREQEWLKDQPKAIQAELQKLQGDERKKLVAELKRQERQNKIDWLMASKFWNELETKQRMPVRIEDLPQNPKDPARDYVKDYLLQFLTAQEKDRLEAAKGQWPLFPMTLIELADKHPPALPGPHGPKSFAELPADVLKRLLPAAAKFSKKDTLPNLPNVLARQFKIREGHWPQFGVELAEAVHNKGIIFDYEFLAYKRDCLHSRMQDFVVKTLQPLLDGDEKIRLADAIGKWPDYPQAIRDLASAHGLNPPWFTFPRPEYWHNYRLPRSLHPLPVGAR
jgi:hypothetical protein